ncbi:hypothetical protein D1007_20028 [Hordeum vulgare]|nr:hypothetical protein D1007_20028 [Hordeum vulgare]
MMDQGPWLFRNLIVLMVSYDAFTRAEEVPMVFMPIWLQIHKIPEGFCKKNIVENLLRNSGEILEVRLNGTISGGVLALTEEKGEDDEPISPTSSSNSKRDRVESSGVSREISAASHEEDHREPRIS